MNKTDKNTWKLIEERDIANDQYSPCMVAIVEHDGQRYLMAQTREHEAMPAVYGLAARINAEDTLDSLAKPWNAFFSTRDAILDSYDPERPLLSWSEDVVYNIMKNVER